MILYNCKNSANLGTACSLTYGKRCINFHLDIGQKFFTVRTINHWNDLPRDMVESPPLEVFKLGLDSVIDDLI